MSMTVMRLARTQTLDLAFGTVQPKTIQDIFSWQLAGAGVATLVGPVAFTQKVPFRSGGVGMSARLGHEVAHHLRLAT